MRIVAALTSRASPLNSSNAIASDDSPSPLPVEGNVVGGPETASDDGVVPGSSVLTGSDVTVGDGVGVSSAASVGDDVGLGSGAATMIVTVPEVTADAVGVS